MDMEFRILTTLNELRRIETDWRQLASEDPSCPIMGSFDWIELWWETFQTAYSSELGHEKELFIICSYTGNKLIAAAPFLKVVRRHLGYPMTCIEFIGQQWGGLYQDIIKAPGSRIDINDFVRFARTRTRFDVIFLKQISARTDRFASDRLIPYSACPELLLDRYSNFDEFLASCSKKLRGNLRQGISRMKKENLAVDFRSDKVDDRAIEAIKAISRSKLQDNKRWLWGDPLKERFYRGLFSRFDSFAAMLRIDGRPAVYFANILFQSRAYCIDGAYDRSFPRFELGNLSVNQSIKTAFELGLKSQCMGPGLDEYKLRQANHLEYLCAYIERGNNLPSHMIAWLVAKAAQQRSERFKESLQSVSIMKKPIPLIEQKLKEHAGTV